MGEANRVLAPKSGDPNQFFEQIDAETWLAPAFADRHCHPLFAARELRAIDLSDCKTQEEIVARIKDHLSENPQVTWLDAAPFNLVALGELKAATLDRVSSKAVITVHSSDHHALWVNTAALEIAGLRDEIPPLSDGTVVTGQDGAPTGLLLEWSAMKLVLDHQPQPNLEDDIENLVGAQMLLARNGVRQVTDAWIDQGMAEVYLEAEKRGLLKMHYELFVRMSPSEVDEQLKFLRRLIKSSAIDSGGKNVEIAGVKIFLDGVLSSKTAAVLEPYNDGTFGQLIWNNDALRDLLQLVAGISPELRPHFHAIGDRAIRQALDAIAVVEAADLWTGSRRPVLAHAELVAESDVTRIVDLGVEVVISPQWLDNEDDRKRLLEHITAATLARVGDFAHMYEAGVMLTYGSDWPVSNPHPFEAITAAAGHLEAKGFDRASAIEAAWSIASGQLRQVKTQPSSKAKLRLSGDPREVKSLSDLLGLKID